MRFRRANPLFSCGRIYRIHKILASKYRAIAGYSNCCFPFLTRRELHVRACSHAGGRGPHVGEVPACPYNLSASRLHDRWGDHMKDYRNYMNRWITPPT